MKNRKKALSIGLLMGAILLVNQCTFKKTLLYQNTDLPIAERVNDLVSRLTLDEKISQMMYSAKAIPRLEIPEYNWSSEGLHGVCWAGLATVFPEPVGLAASWDTAVVNSVASVIATEFRAKYKLAISQGNRTMFKGLTVWSPNINIFRDPRWGRGQETYGEDPYLTARMGVSFVKGLQGDDPKYFKTVSSPKHYAVHSGPEPQRHYFDARTNGRDLLDTYLPAFKACIVEGKAYSIMGAYTKYMGIPCCANTFLLDSVLRKTWGFNGYVVSDCGAINDIYKTHKFVKTPAEAAAIAVKAGTDLECGETFAFLKEAVEKKLITEKEIDRAVKRLFTARFKLGMFDPDDMVSWAKTSVNENNTEAHRQLALKAAHEAIVLLRNEKHTLPLDKNLRTIAVIGPNADMPYNLLGNYNGYPNHAVTPLEGIRKKLGTQTKVLFSKGTNIADTNPAIEKLSGKYLSNDGKQGLKGEYFNNTNLEGKPILIRSDSIVYFEWDAISPDKRLKTENFSVRWTGQLTVPEAGEYYLAFTGDDGYRIYLNDKLICEDWKVHGIATHTMKVVLKKNKPENIKIEYYQGLGAAVARLELVKSSRNTFNEALEVASRSDAIVFVGGITSQLEGEESELEISGFKGGDRTSLDLPINQLQLLKALKATGKPCVFVVFSGSGIALNWESQNIPAIVQAWYPGEQGGNAIADVLFGDYNPSGRLPITFYKSVTQLPPFEDYSMKGRTYRYFTFEPVYAFGHGLSYTTFKYTNLKVPECIKKGESIQLSVDVQNTGKLDGTEVIQLYLKDLEASVPVPNLSLQGFKRIPLKAGEKKTVAFTLKPEQLCVISNELNYIIEPGAFKVYVGGNQPDLKDVVAKNILSAKFTVIN